MYQKSRLTLTKASELRSGTAEFMYRYPRIYVRMYQIALYRTPDRTALLTTWYLVPDSVKLSWRRSKTTGCAKKEDNFEWTSSSLSWSINLILNINKILLYRIRWKIIRCFWENALSWVIPLACYCLYGECVLCRPCLNYWQVHLNSRTRQIHLIILKFCLIEAYFARILRWTNVKI